MLRAVVFALCAAARARAQLLECAPNGIEIRRLTFSGNHAFTSDDLASRIVTTPSSFFQRTIGHLGTKRCLDRDELAKDITRLEQFYVARGFPSTTVDTLVQAMGAHAAAVTFTIHEGQPILIDSLSITGLAAVAGREQILDGLGVTAGSRFDQDQVYAAADSIESRLRNRGYAAANVVKGWNRENDSHRASVRLDVVTGPRMRIGAIKFDSIQPYQSVAGPKPREISDSVVRHLVDISRGDIYSDASLIAAQRNLYQTSDYLHAEVVPLGVDSLKIDPAAIQAGDTLITLEVRAREDLTRQIGGELVGWATLDCFRTRPQYSDHNFGKEANDLEVTLQLSKIGYGNPGSWGPTHNLCGSQLNQDIIASPHLNYSLNTTFHPPVIGSHALPTYSLYTERHGEYLAYLRTTYVGGEAALTREIQPDLPVRVGYTLEYGNTQSSPALLCAVFSRCTDFTIAEAGRTLPFAVASVSAQRSSANSPIDPTNGGILRGELRGSSRYLGSDSSLSFAKGTMDAIWYHGLTSGVVLAMRFRAGSIVGGATENGVRLPPPQERLYAGGANSIRGFPQNQLGELIYLVFDTTKVNTVAGGPFTLKGDSIYDRIVPVGGNSLVIANVDLRLRDPFFPKLLQYTLFVDAGALSDTNQVSFSKLLVTPGVGVRVSSPVGPIQLNVGYNPYPQPGGPLYLAVNTSPTPLPPGSPTPTTLFCISPTNTLTVTNLGGGNYKQTAGTCPPYQPPQSRTLLHRLTLTVSIGTDF